MLVMFKYLRNFLKSGRLFLVRQISLKCENPGKLLSKQPVLLAFQVNSYAFPTLQLKIASFSSKSNKKVPKNLNSLFEYEKVAEETLEILLDKFEEVFQDSEFKDWDVNYSNGVLTVIIEENCIYVINKQTPNRQIWLSSPFSGPKRYDYVGGSWIYKRDGTSLHELLTKELTEKLQKRADFLILSVNE